MAINGLILASCQVEQKSIGIRSIPTGLFIIGQFPPVNFSMHIYNFFLNSPHGKSSHPPRKAPTLLHELIPRLLLVVEEDCMQQIFEKFGKS